MTVRRSKPSFASLLRHASRREDDIAPAELPLPGANGAFYVDPSRIRLWNGLIAPTAEECRDRIAAIVRDGQAEPVTVRPVFDDTHYEYEVIAGARDYVAVRHLHDSAIPALELLVRVELIDDAAVSQAATVRVLPDAILAAFGGATLSDDIMADLATRLEGPLGPLVVATAVQIARVQAARRDDGLPPYSAAEVIQLIGAVGQEDAFPPLSLNIVSADGRAVTFRLSADETMPPEMLARIVKAMIDGAADDGMAVSWAQALNAAKDP